MGDKIVNNVEQDDLEFNNEKFKEWSNMAKHCSSLLVLAEKFDGRDRMVPTSTGMVMGRAPSKRG